MPPISKLNAKIRKEYEESMARSEKAFQEFIRDAIKSPRLNDWESNFINNIVTKHTTYATLSDAQIQKIEQIQEKIYAAG